MEIRLTFFKTSEPRPPRPLSTQYATCNVYIFKKLITTKCAYLIYITLRNPAFKNKTGRSLSQDSSYLRLGTMCSTENPVSGDQTATTEGWTADQKSGHMWELTECCWLATYYLWRNNRHWCSLWNSNEPTGKHLCNHKTYS
jgi:hypothetical protein